MATKIENLIKPNLRNAYMHMFLILQTGKAKYTNRAADECFIAPSSIEELASKFSPYVPTTPIEYEYVTYGVDIDKWPGYPEVGAAKAKRLTNHINQFITWRTCAREVSKMEVAEGRRFHAILRLRDNALVLRPFNIMDRLMKLNDQIGRPPLRRIGLRRTELVTLPVVTKNCSSWNGVNDKVPPRSLASPLRVSFPVPNAVRFQAPTTSLFPSPPPGPHDRFYCL